MLPAGMLRQQHSPSFVPFASPSPLKLYKSSLIQNKPVVTRTSGVRAGVLPHSLRQDSDKSRFLGFTREEKKRVQKFARAKDNEKEELVAEDEKHWQLIPLTKKGNQKPISVPKGGVILGGSAQRSLPLQKPKSDYPLLRIWRFGNSSLSHVIDQHLLPPTSSSFADSLETATLRLTEDGLVIEDVGNDTLVGDRSLQQGERILLQHSDRITVGGSTFLISSEANVEEALPDDGYVLPDSESQLPDHRGRPPPPPVPYPSKPTLTTVALDYGQWAISLGLLYAGNRALAGATASAGIAFPSPLIGMFGIIAVLTLVDLASKPAAENLYAFFNPALDWIARWLPVFYVPPLVALPLAIEGIPGASLLKILLVVLVGMPATLFVTALIATTIRQAVNTELEAPEKLPEPKPFSSFHHALWGAVFVASLLGGAMRPEQYAHTLARPCLVAATVEGFLIGNALPKGLQTVLHPLVICTIFANLASFVYSKAVGWTYKYGLAEYITKGTAISGENMMGSGDYLMSFLGVVILTFGFRIFSQRRLMFRHAPEIFGSTTLASAFSLFATVGFAKILGLSAEIARALAPRSVTVALAIPIAQQLNAPTSIAAAAVALTGLLGSNFVQVLLNQFGHKDPITRGLATAGASHGLGTAALAGKEPEALPFCALAYALIGIISTILVSIPFIRSALIALAG